MMTTTKQQDYVDIFFCRSMYKIIVPRASAAFDDVSSSSEKCINGDALVYNYYFSMVFLLLDF